MAEVVDSSVEIVRIEVLLVDNLGIFNAALKADLINEAKSILGSMLTTCIDQIEDGEEKNVS